MAGKTCVICGAPSGMYPLCTTHLKMKNEGKVIKCETCGTWHETAKPCKCKQQNEVLQNRNETESNNIVIIDKNNKGKCITCGKQTDGVLFCGPCFYKYKDKELLFKITKCSSVELLDESYEGLYTCKDGHVVKSKSERDIDNYLFAEGIPHAYEKALSYGRGEKEVVHPDFYLKDYLGKGKDVYIEHWGYNENNLHYTKTKKFKMKKYQEMGITLICTHEQTDAKDIDAVLERKLKKEFIRENEINFDN